MKQHVFKRRRRIGGKVVKARTYTGRYRLSGDQRDTTVPLKVSDEQVARAKLAAIVKREEMERQGLAAPRRQVETASMSVTQGVNEWLSDMAAKGRAPDHIRISGLILGALVRDCGWKRIGDIQPESFLRWRSANSSKAPKTLNEYLGRAMTFLNWLIKSGRLPSNPLAGVEKVSTKGKERRTRRALSHDELLRLLEVTDRKRGVVYAVAALTGLRRSELVSLRWDDFDLEGEVPSVTIQAANAKNRETVTLPLHEDLSSLLREYYRECGSPPKSAKALEVPSRLTAFNRDLASAGIQRIDAKGRRIDLHALRHSYNTHLAIAGVMPTEAMQLMRHSDVKLTTKVYVDENQLPLAASVGKLPGLNPKKGTLIGTPDLGVEGPNESQRVATKGAEKLAESSVVELLSRALSHLVATGKMAPEVGFEPTT